MNLTLRLRNLILLAIILTLIPCRSIAQRILNKPVTLSVKGQPVSQVLKEMEEQAKFYFSYNSNLVSGDSLVTLSASGKPVKEVLDQLFKGIFQYKEKGDYVIILPAAKEKVFYISGFILDQETNAPVDYASVYSRQLLVSALTEDNGRFRLRIRDRAFPLLISISKVGYGDTTIVINRQEDTDLNILISQKAVDLDPLIVRYAPGEGSWLARLFLSAKQRAQSRNIGKFFVALPYQASLTPGLGTHGRMSSQVVNKFSLNLLGGYTAGVNGVEIAGGFNISKQNVRIAQVAGIFNVVAGKVNGVQIAGGHNQVLDSLTGVQVSGYSGIVGEKIEGVQVSGFLSRGAADMGGVQVSGGLNLLKGHGKGMQISSAYNQAGGDYAGMQLTGGLNMARKKLSGFQLGAINYTKNLQGVQLGIVNIADSSSGVSLGLINIIRKSTSNISLYASEIVPINVAWKMGTHKFYGILSVGATAGTNRRTYLLGAGIGREFYPFKKWGFFTEITSVNIYQGTWDNTPFLFRLQTAATCKLNKRFLVFAGPSFSICQNNVEQKKAGYKDFPITGYPTVHLNDKLGSWIGWQAGVSWRYGRL